MNVWYRMLDVAGNQSAIGYKELDEQDDSLFRPARMTQPYSQFEGTTVLLCAIGPRAQQALQEAVAAEREFDPKHWDSDGYYVGPSKTQ